MSRFDAVRRRGDRMRERTLLRLLAVGVLLCSLWSSHDAFGQRLRPEDVPPELQPWIPWVLDRGRDEGCRTIDEETICVWPSELALDLGAQGGTFTLHVLVNYESPVKLPGSSEVWPEEVQSGTKAIVVTDVDGTPTAILPAGSHDIHGKFSWARLPDSLAIPSSVALVTLRISDKAVPFPDRRDAQVLLESGVSEIENAEQGGETRPGAPRDEVSLQVARRIEDGVPLQVATYLRLRVSGRGREVNLGNVLLEGSSALRLDSSVPAHLTDAGALIARVQPGTHEITLTARMGKPPERLLAPKLDAPWPDHEIWAWAPAPAIREVDLTGAPAVDPSRTDIPDAWKTLTAFKLQPGTALTFSTKRRGVSEPPRNQLVLQRELWLDRDGSGWSVKDHISGRIARRWRLDLREGTLGHAIVDGQDQLITRSNAGGYAGVELRRGDVNLDAEWRLTGMRKVPAVAWSEDFERIDTTVHLPPGWDLAHATGVDDLSRSWLDRFNLVRLLVVLGIALAVAKLLSPRWAIIAAIALVLAMSRPNVPTAAIIALLVMTALSAVVPIGRIRRVVRVAWVLTAVALVFGVMQFSAVELRDALYPQAHRDILMVEAINPFVLTRKEAVEEMPAAALSDQKEGGTGTRAKGEDAVMQSLKAKARPSSPEEQIIPESLGALGTSSRSGQGTGAPADAAKPNAPPPQDPNAVIQTGEGTPSWQSQTWDLHWPNPVGQSHRVRLWLISPVGNALLAGLRVALFVALTFFLVRASSRATREKPPAPGGASVVTAAMVLGALLTWSSPARAEPPPGPELLQELKTRLTRPPVLVPERTCAPNCVSVSRMDVLVENNVLTLRAEVHAAAPDVYKLPGPATTWVPSSVDVDGKPTRALTLLSDGAIHLRLDAGRFVVQMRGPFPGSSLTLDPGLPPKRVSVVAHGYQVDGVDENGRATGSLQITRMAPEEGAPPAGGATESSSVHDMPTWLRVSRTLDIGVAWTVTTRVERLSPGTAPLLVRIPLLPGERVTASGITVEKDNAVFSLGPNAEADGGAPSSTAEWTGVLPPTDTLKLTATPDSPWTERWTLRCGTIWRCVPEGLAPVEETQDGIWAPVYLPWPGETLSIGFRRPDSAPGRSVTIDNVVLKLSPDTRQTRATLELTARSSSLGSELIRLPPNARVEELLVDNTRRSVRSDDRVISVQLKPGTQQVLLRWRDDRALGIVFRAPGVSLGHGAVNASVEVSVPENRWILSAAGGAVGPAVTVWSYLALLVLLGAGIAFVVVTPLRPWQAVLLSAGLTQVDPVAAVVVGTWFVLFALRKTAVWTSPFAFNARQVLLVLLTLATALILAYAVVNGLLQPPDMGLEPYDYARHEGGTWVLRFYVDRIAGAMPEPSIVTAPVWLWKALNVVWVLWLLAAARGWMPWAWSAFTTGGAWKKSRRIPKTEPQPPPAPTP